MTTRIAADIFPPDTVTPEWEALGRADDTRRMLLDPDARPAIVFAEISPEIWTTVAVEQDATSPVEEYVSKAKMWAPAPWTVRPFVYTWRVAIRSRTGEIVQSGPAEIVYLPDEETPVIDVEPAVEAAARALFYRLHDRDEWTETAAEKCRDAVRPHVTVAATVLEIQWRRGFAAELDTRAEVAEHTAKHLSTRTRTPAVARGQLFRDLAAELRDLDRPLTP